MLILLLLLVVAACAVAVFRWRWGVFAAIVVGLLLDPLRKMVPGVPGYLAMVSLPVWMAVIVSALFSGEMRARNFLSNFPRFAKSISIFGLYLLIPAALAISYGRNSWQIALLGAVIYMAAFLIVATGWSFPKTQLSGVRILSFYALCTSVLLIGGPLDYFGFGEGLAAIGTQAMDAVWVTYRTGEAVYMYAGFFRSPDVMGWHAALVAMIAGLMAARSRGWVRGFWIALSVWGLLNIWICGRRKMIAMLPVFWGVFLLLTFKFKNIKRTVPLVGVLLLVVGAGWFGVTRTYHATAVDTFYLSAVSEADETLLKHSAGAVATTVRQAGFWGYGLGMSQQGVHHINADKPRLWQEGGPGKIFAELGVPGAILLLWVGAILLLTAYHIVGYCAESPSFYSFAGIFSILVANMAAGIVSAQIFGDPFILLLLAFLMGLLLSGAKNVKRE